MGTNERPRPAATVILARDRPQGTFEVLMLKRNLNSDFVGGAYVFPGGAVDLDDATDEASTLCIGLDDARASVLLGVERGGLGYWIACLRELFEEAGLLFAQRADGSPLDMADPATTARFVEHRRTVNDRSRRFLDVIKEEGLLLDLDELSYFAHWITPQGSPRRYDTRFFVAAAPPDQVPVHDDIELVANTWVTPGEALERHRRDEMELILPTIRNLQAIDRFSSSRDLLDAARRATDVPTVEPRIVVDGHGFRILLPGDAGFDDPDVGDAGALAREPGDTATWNDHVRKASSDRNVL
jgi:8-oxo-dGTP pyrophosphatase MutT (NUDIX family)